MQQYNPANPLIVQGDRTVLLEVDNPSYAEARDELAPFAELEKSPEHIHTYRLTPLSLWNAAAAGMTAEEMVEVLGADTKFPVAAEPRRRPRRTRRPIRPRPAGTRRRRRAAADLDRPAVARRSSARRKGLRDLLFHRVDETTFAVDDADRGVLKQQLIAAGYPAEDLAGYSPGAPLAVELREGAAPAGRSRSATTSGNPSTPSTPAATPGEAPA